MRHRKLCLLVLYDPLNASDNYLFLFLSCFYLGFPKAKAVMYILWMDRWTVIKLDFDDVYFEPASYILGVYNGQCIICKTVIAFQPLYNSITRSSCMYLSCGIPSSCVAINTLGPALTTTALSGKT